jgi:hypothetical protein
MRVKYIGLSVGLAAVVWSACELQPERQCAVARAVSDGSIGSFAATYDLKPGQDETRPCARLQPEPVGLQKYFDPQGPGRVAVRTERMGALVAQYRQQLGPEQPPQPYSLGELESGVPGADDFCAVPQLSSARLDVPGTPARSFLYEWSNLRIYNTPEVPGTQFVADLRYTEDGCSAEYKVQGIWPVVRCRNSRTGLPDESLCDPYADPAAGRLRGSGINPLFPVRCHPQALICVLTGEVPSTRTP